MSTKSYLLDTSVILDDIQNIVYLYQDGANALFLSDTIIDELDKKKELMNEMGYFVREFFRNLYTPEESSTTTESQQFQGIDSDNVCARSGGSGGLAPTADNKFAQQTCSKNNDYIRQIYFIHNTHHIPITLIYRPHYEIPHQDHSLNDTKIITIAKDYNLTLLTNDISLKIRALTQNLNAQSLFRDRVENPEKIDFW
ncbi:PIN domain-containing protein, partial [uncultured Helicobacter sp.]|uniref:PIN domain-containing protein n=1 Tax=uncultured Helicobacter sp. TaxID=175537 RepID=UPI003752F3E8